MSRTRGAFARRCWRSLGLAAALGLATSAGAVVISAGDGTGNTTPPLDDPGFANTGAAYSLSGTYLRGGFVLAAFHVGEPQIILKGQTYPSIPGSRFQFSHGGGAVADLAVFRIDGAPALPFPKIASTPPLVGEEVIVVGNGWNRQAAVTAWDANWVEVPLPGVHRGYKKGAGRSVRWGSNTIELVGMEWLQLPQNWTTQFFAVRFDESGLPDESQAVNGDSGGAVWVKRNGEWELAGILFLQLASVGQEGQPADTAVFDNFSGAVDLSYYRDQIMAAVVPPIPILPGPWVALLGALLVAAGRPALRRRRSAPPSTTARTPGRRAGPRG